MKNAKMMQGLGAAAVSMFCGTVTAAVILPTGLPLGSKYQIIFVTSGKTNALSGLESYYNNFAQSQAASSVGLAPSGTTWHAITETYDGTTHVTANTNAPTFQGVPIYNTNGQLILSNGGTFYNAVLFSNPDLTVLSNPVGYDQYGNLVAVSYLTDVVWTGIGPGGTVACGAHNFAYVGEGLSATTNGQFALEDSNLGLVDTLLPIFSLSSPITVVPEPSTLALLIAGAVGLFGIGWRRRRTRMLRGLLAVALVGSAVIVRASTIPMATVPVGNPGNASDRPANLSQNGSVNYSYNIGKYDVTNDQYCAFLNMTAASSDPLALWNSNMTTLPEGGINRSGSGPYTYTVKPGQGSQPVVAVTFYDALRFANWLDNGQGTGATESGAYTLLGGTPTPSNSGTISRNSGASWFLPSEDEWYKAAYYDPTLNGGAGGYWQYPTRSNTLPTWELSTVTGPNPGNNSGNFHATHLGFAVTGAEYNPALNYLTNVGAYPNSISAYGTLDQMGEVLQWNEREENRDDGLRGGSWGSDAVNLSSAWVSDNVPTAEEFDIGFRVASAAVPEPSCIVLLIAGAVGLLAFARRRRRLA